ncbi:hypothetical protein DAI22_09g067850 [Oryza sativa Japonica Group]|nr:hypothetical protein DAI22_09g067850 [Oryza sativa Japonica Group]
MQWQIGNTEYMTGNYLLSTSARCCLIKIHPRPTLSLVPPAAGDGEAAASQLPLSSPEVSRGSVPAITCPVIYRATQKVYCADLCRARNTTVNS